MIKKSFCIFLLGFMLCGMTVAKTEVATFAGGCFWCMQPPYDGLPGVLDTVVGYTGGHLVSPTYEAVSTGQTGHLEAVQITFDPTKTSYAQLVEVFWRNINPSQTDGQFADIGSQYETAIFYHSVDQKKTAEASKKALIASGKFKSVSTRVVPATVFYPAEKEHQDFYKHHPLRYNRYKTGSGRQGFIESTWKKDTP